MLPKENRLKKKKDFEMVIKNGKAVGGSFLVLKFLKKQSEQTRVGFVVSKKISNKAVVRNKVKRRLKEAVRANVPDLKQGYDLVFFTKQAIVDKTFAEIKEAVEQLLWRAGIMNNEL